jgi:Na+/H+ antiporter NhaB
MFDFLSLFLDFIAVCFIVLIVVIGIKFFHSLVTSGQSNCTYNEDIDKQLREDSREDSQGDGLVLFDDPLFPEEPGDGNY